LWYMVSEMKWIIQYYTWISGGNKIA